MNDETLTDIESTITPQITLLDLDQQQIDAILQTVPAGAKNVQEIYPLSPSQEGMLFHHLLNEQSDTYVLSTLFEFESRAQVGALIDGLQTVINRHDVLRTAIIWEQLPQPVQVVYRQAALPIEELVLDLDRDPIEQLEEIMRSGCQGLNLQRAPLMRLQIATDGGARCYALLRRHHIVFDHQSWNVAFAEAMACVRGRERGFSRRHVRCCVRRSAERGSVRRHRDPQRVQRLSSAARAVRALCHTACAPGRSARLFGTEAVPRRLHLRAYCVRQRRMSAAVFRVPDARGWTPVSCVMRTR